MFNGSYTLSTDKLSVLLQTIFLADDPVLRKRADAVRQLAQGRSERRVAADFDTDVGTLRYWWLSFAHGGTEALSCQDRFGIPQNDQVENPQNRRSK